MNDPVPVTAEVLAAHPLPDHGSSSSKNERGTALVIGGSRETPGAALLAATAALRAGAGTVQVATADAAAVPLAVALPEARVVGLAPPGDVDAVRSLVGAADATLLGTGMTSDGLVERLLGPVLASSAEHGRALVLDAGALDHVDRELLAPVRAQAVLMPNPAEMARLTDRPLDAVLGEPEAALHEAVERFACTVALRGAETWIGGPDHATFIDRSGNAGLAASGSGDVVAGLLVGSLARGATPLAATVWAVRAHGAAGDACAERHGPIGYLAREVADAIPGVMAALSRP